MWSVECDLQMRDYIYLYYSMDLSRTLSRLFYKIFTRKLLVKHMPRNVWSLLEYVNLFLILSWLLLNLLQASSIFLVGPEYSGFPDNLLAGRDILPHLISRLPRRDVTYTARSKIIFYFMILFLEFDHFNFV